METNETFRKDISKQKELITVYPKNTPQLNFTFECDIWLKDVIILLNELGFTTSNCCSGHEDSAFIDFYISFMELSEDNMKSLISIINEVPDLYYNINYEFDVYTKIVTTDEDDLDDSKYDFNLNTNNYIKLTNPSEEDITMARKIVYKDNFDNPEYIDKFEYKNIVIRSKIIEDFNDKTMMQKFKYDDYIRSHIEKNRSIIQSTIDKFKSLLSDYKNKYEN